MKKFVLSSLFLILTASLAFAQSTGGIKGKVRDTKGKSYQRRNDYRPAERRRFKERQIRQQRRVCDGRSQNRNV